MAKTKKVRKNSSPASERINNQARKSTKTGGTTPQSILTEDRGDWNNKDQVSPVSFPPKGMDA